MEKGTLKGAQMRAFYFLPQMILSIMFLFLTNIFIFLTNMLVKKKKKCYNVFSWKKERFSYGSHMDSVYPFSVYRLRKLRKEDKKVEQTY